MTLLETAHLLRGTYQTACIPVTPQKTPLFPWAKYASQLPSDAELSTWFTNGESIAILAGRIQCLDVDIKNATPELWTQYRERIQKAGLMPLLDRLVISTTRSAGYHVLFRCPAELRNVKLASAPDGKVILETRGTGGYFLVAPSPGYKVIQGSLDAIPEITQDERDDLLAIAVSFDHKPKLRDAGPAAAGPRADGELSPGDDFDARANVPALLEGHGWTRVDPDAHHWRRPGKDTGISASWDIVPGRFWCWSTSTPFESSKGYRPWHVFAVLECNGDFHDAARTLGKMGYGSPARAPGSAKAAESPPADGAAKAEETTFKPFTMWRPSQFLAWVEPPNTHFLLPAYVTRGELTAIVGQAGVGKTRLALWLAFCQIARLSWCGLETAADSGRWMFLSDENSILRLKDDLAKMLSNFDADQRAFLDNHLILHAILEEDDGNFWLGDAVTRGRMKATIAAHKPDVVIADPLANLAPDDPSKPEGMKATLRAISDIMRFSAPKAARILIHHAKPGRQNMLGGVGYDASAYASGGKALVATARCQINVLPGSEEDPNQLVLACGKVNNCAPFSTRGITFDPSNFTYHVNEDFDLQDWRAKVEGKARSGHAFCTISDVVSVICDGKRSTSDLVSTLMVDCSVSKSTVERTLGKAVDAGAVMTETRGLYMLGPKANRYK